MLVLTDIWLMVNYQEPTAKFGTSFEDITGITTVLTYPIETESSHKALVKVSVEPLFLCIIFT